MEIQQKTYKGDVQWSQGKKSRTAYQRQISKKHQQKTHTPELLLKIAKKIVLNMKGLRMSVPGPWRKLLEENKLWSTQKWLGNHRKTTDGEQ